MASKSEEEIQLKLSGKKRERETLGDSGRTTGLNKLFRNEKKTVTLAAGDDFQFSGGKKVNLLQRYL